jgi:hypothetical protein
MASHNAHPPEQELPPPPPQWASQDELARALNTALVSTRAQPQRNHSEELFRLMESPGFRAILEAIRHLALSRRITEKQAAEEVITAFRRADELWGDYVYQQGLERLKVQKTESLGAGQ